MNFQMKVLYFDWLYLDVTEAEEDLPPPPPPPPAGLDSQFGGGLPPPPDDLPPPPSSPVSSSYSELRRATELRPHQAPAPAPPPQQQQQPQTFYPQYNPYVASSQVSNTFFYIFNWHTDNANQVLIISQNFRVFFIVFAIIMSKA